MELLINKAQLDTLMHEQGIRNYRDLARKAKLRGLPLSEGTIYKMVEEATWTATRLAALCQMLECKPADIIPEWQETETPRHTHGTPRPQEELEGQPA